MSNHSLPPEAAALAAAAAKAVPALLVHEAGRILAIASVAWFMWDWALTIDQELEYIWRAPRLTFVKCLFYINRYFMFFVLVIHTRVAFSTDIEGPLCPIANNFYSFSTIINVGVTEVMIMLRLWALYGKDRRMLVFLICLYGTALIITIVVLSVGITEAVDTTTPFPRLVSCSRTLPSYFGSPFLVTLIDQTIFFILTFAKSYQHVRSQAKTPVLRALMREGLIFYILSLWAVAFMITGAFYPPLGSAAYGSLFVNVAFSVTGSRLTLNMRAIQAPPRNQTSVFAKNGGTRITTADLPEFADIDEIESTREDAIPLRDMESS